MRSLQIRRQSFPQPGRRVRGLWGLIILRLAVPRNILLPTQGALPATSRPLSKSVSPVGVAPLASAQHLLPSFTCTKPWYSSQGGRGLRFPACRYLCRLASPQAHGVWEGEGRKAPPAWPLAFCMVPALKRKHTRPSHPSLLVLS